jgi:two-component system, cell cycle response regulator
VKKPTNSFFKETPMAQQEAQPQASSHRALEVLLVDDHPIQLSLARHLFQQDGHRVIEAKNGAEALLAIAEHPPDIVVSDCQMPLLDGYQLCRLLKDDPATRRIPVLLLTAYGGGLNRFWARTCGADRFLIKGRDLDQVVAVAKALVESLPPSTTPERRRLSGLATEHFSVDAIQSRLAKALEQKLLETSMRDAIARLYTEDHDTERLIRGFLDILHELALPGALLIAIQSDGENQAIGIHGLASQEPELERLRLLLEDELGDSLSPRWSAAEDPEERRSSLRDPMELLLPAPTRDSTLRGAMALRIERQAAVAYERLFITATEELGRLLSLETSRLKLYQQATQDPLTGLFNRRHALELLGLEATQSQRFGLPLSVMVIDLDHFKPINDRFGHPVGDQVLGVVAQRLAFGLRKVDRLGRLGGDEFLAFCPQTDRLGAINLAQRLLDQVASAPIPGLPAPSEPIGLSIGIASWRGKDDSVDQLLARADACLYRAKAEGRNRIVAEE